MHPTKLFLTWYVDTVLQSFKKVSGFNDASVPNFKGFKCVMQSVRLFQISRENLKKKIEPVES